MTSGKLLIVDDDKGAMKNLEQAFKKEGYAVTATQSGGNAQALLEKQPFDVVLGSVHAIRGWVFTNGGAELEKWKTVDVAAVWREYFDLVGQMADTGLFDIVTHLDAPKHSGYWPPES